MASIGRTRQLPPADTGRPGTGRETNTLRWRSWAAASAAAVMLAVGTGATVYVMQEQRVREQSAATAAVQIRETRAQAILGAPT